jgi:hypothetical protein
MSNAFREACDRTSFGLTPMMLEVSISCFRRWLDRDFASARLNLKSLAYRAILEEVSSIFIPQGCQLVLRGQALPHSSYLSESAGGSFSR